MLHQHLVQRATLPPFGQSCCSKEHNSSLHHRLQAHGAMEHPRPPGGEHRARWLAAVHCRSIEDSCRSGAHAWCSQPWPAPPAVPPTSTKHAVGAHRPVQFTRPGRRVGASSVSGRRPEYLAVAPRSGRGHSAGSGDWLSGHDPHRAPPRKRKFPSFPLIYI